MSADLIPPLISRAISGFANCDRSNAGFRDWLQTGTYTFLQIDSDTFELQRVPTNDLLPTLAYDFWQVAFACLESLCTRIDFEKQPKSQGWRIIRQYYAAYFAAHALMRLLGQAATRLERAEAKRLAEIGTMYVGATANVEVSQYKISMTSIHKPECEIRFSKFDPSGTGDHQKFWRSFCNFLENLATDVASRNDIDATNVVARIIEVTSALKSNGYTNGGWLSNLRNVINYQFQHGVWFPYNGYDKTDKITDKRILSSGIRLDFDSKLKPISLFDSLTQLISSLCVEATAQIALMSPTDSDYVERWKSLYGIFEKQR